MTDLSNYKYNMWSVVLVSLLFRVTEVLGQNVVEFTQVENRTNSVDGFKENIHELKENQNDVKIMKFRSLLDNLAEWIFLNAEKIEEKSRAQTTLHLNEERRLKHKKTEFKFLMKLLITLKVVLSIILPLGIIASKILSWKAVTISLMAFMLAKILFVKNLLMGKKGYLVNPGNIVSPFLVQGAPNDVFWRRQGDAQNVHQWESI